MDSSTTSAEKISDSPKKEGDLLRDTTILVLLTICALLVVFNIILLQKSYFQSKELKAQKQKEQDRIAERQKAGLEEIARWQLEISSWPYLEKAILLLLEKDYDSALLYLSISIEKYPENPISYFLRGLANESLKKNKEAIEDFSCYLSQVPSSSQGFWKRSLLYYEQGKKTLALEDIKKALLNDPQNKEAQDFLEKFKEK